MTADEDIVLLINAYIDGELSPGEALAMERRLAAEPKLRAEVERLTALSNAVRETLTGVPVPDTLRGGVIRKVGFTDAVPRRGWQMPQQPLAATLLIGVLAGASVGSTSVYFGMAGRSQATSDAVRAGHLRSLIAPQPFDIASSDQHVVKPWFNGRTTIAPEAPDLADKGFPLIGGRVDVVDGKPVPTLVYRRNRHVISVTIVPTTGGASDGSELRDGSTIERWSAGDLTYWAVSDLNQRDLRVFIDLFQAKMPRQG